MGFGFQRRLPKQAPLFQVHPLIWAPIGCEGLAFRNSIPLREAFFNQDALMCRGKQTHLWSGEHVQAPGTHFAIGGDGDEVMSILGPNNIYTVHGMLRETKTWRIRRWSKRNAYIWVSNTLLWNRAKEWHSPTIMEASGRHCWLEADLFVSKLWQHHGVVEILRAHLARSEAVQWSKRGASEDWWDKRDTGECAWLTWGSSSMEFGF